MLVSLLPRGGILQWVWPKQQCQCGIPALTPMETQSSGVNHKTFDNIANNLDRAYHFYQEGNSKSKKRVVKITCDAVDVRPCKDNSPAYMADPTITESEMWELVLCPPFWKGSQV